MTMKTLILFLALAATALAQPLSVGGYYRTTSTAYTFKPSDITGLKLWLYADTLKTLESKAVGDTLYRWQDISDNGYHMVNTTASQKPVLRDSATVWGAPGGTVQFDGSDDYLSRTQEIMDTVNGYTVFLVSRLVSFNTAYKAVWGIQATGAYFGMLFSTAVGYADVWMGISSGSLTDKAKWATYVPTYTRVLTVYGRTVASSRFARADSVELTRSQGDGYSGSLAANELGRFGPYAGQYYNGHIMEWAVYDRILSITDIRRVEEYLKRKYSL